MNSTASASWTGSLDGSVLLWQLVVAAALGYLLGSLPFGYLVARAYGVNIFTVGSRSSGATNVLRTLGTRAGYTVFALDVLKGALAAGWPLYFAWEACHRPGTSDSVAAAGLYLSKLLGMVGLVFALLGHSFSCFTHFKGGKGVATGAGGFLVLMPAATLAAAAAWTIAFFASRYVSLASIVSAVTIPFAALFFGEPAFLTLAAVAVATFVIVRHRGNIARLIRGTENKPGEKKGARP